MACCHGDIQVSRSLEDFDVTETSTSDLTGLYPNVKVIIQHVKGFEQSSKV